MRPRVRLRALVIAAVAMSACASDGVVQGGPLDPGPAAPTSLRAPGTDTVDTNETSGTVELEYVDIAGELRHVRAELRLPDGVPGDSLPVVVWSHGGSQGFRDPARVGERWGRAFNEAGFAFVAVAHPQRPVLDRPAVCDAVGAAACDEFNPMFWDRPHDLSAVLDWVESVADVAGLDPRRIVLAGHSAGAMGVLHAVGLEWTLPTSARPTIDDRAVAVIAASPPGADARDLDEASLAAVDLPTLFLTGAGDSTSSTEAEDRRATFDLLPADAETELLWIDRPEARHGLFNLSTDACRRAGGTRAGCRTGARLVADTATAFATRVVER